MVVGTVSRIMVPGYGSGFEIVVEGTGTWLRYLVLLVSCYGTRASCYGSGHRYQDMVPGYGSGFQIVVVGAGTWLQCPGYQVCVILGYSRYGTKVRLVWYYGTVDVTPGYGRHGTRLR